MGRTILVDTEDLDRKAKRLLELGDIFRDMGDRMNATCLGVPSYNGQLGNPARNASTQILYEAGVMKDAFQAYGECLQKVADEFRKTDQTSIEYWIKFYMESFLWGVNLLKYFFLGADSLDGDMVNGYRKFLAYREEGTIITIWYSGEPLSFDLADPSLSPEEREALRAKLARYKELMQETYAHLMNAIGGDENLFGVALGMLGIGANVKDIVTVLVKLGLAVGKIPDMEKELMMAEASFNEAAAIWQELNSQDIPGKVATP
jgi:hypothetical protein